ncbi:MAG: hypothetical protein HYY61_06780 [Deltaproteobacteria bacterium]|nr:hypothetical protein [Deltaproteobacteria bacterium]
MKRVFLFGISALFLVTNAFALDLSSFSGTWKLSGENGPDELNISLKEGVLGVKGLLEDDLKNMEIPSKGEITFEGIPVTFTSGSYDDKTLIIHTTFHSSKVSAAPDMVFAISLKIDEKTKKLQVQTAGIGFSSDRGLTAEVESFSYDKQK